MSNLYCLCHDCLTVTIPPGLSAAPGICTSCHKPRSTRPLHDICPACSVAGTFPRCEKCGKTVGTVTPVPDAKDVLSFSPEEIEIVTFNGCSAKIREDFQAWVLSMTHDLDRETGDGPDGALEWVKMHNARFTTDGVHQTYILVYRPTNQVVATGSIVADDRDVAKTYQIPGEGFWGFHNVHRELRGRGLGKICTTYRDRICQAYADRLGQPAIFNAFTANPTSVGILTNLGFTWQREIYIEVFKATENLYSKTYYPSGSAAAS